MNMEDFDRDGSDIVIEFKAFEYENEDENDFVPVDPLDRIPTNRYAQQVRAQTPATSNGPRSRKQK